MQVMLFQKVVHIWLLFSRNLCLRAGNSALHISCSCGSLTMMNRRGVNSCDDNCKTQREDIISKVCLEQLFYYSPPDVCELERVDSFFDSTK